MHLGMALAFGASVFWAFSPVFFAAAGRRTGAYNLNVLRLGMAGLMISAIAAVYAIVAGGTAVFILPQRCALFLVLSGLSGLVIGDMFYLKALTILGPRRTTQFITLAPILPVIFAWIILDERLSWNILLGIALIVGGIAYIVFHEQTVVAGTTAEPGHFSSRGFLIALIGVVFHSMGAVFARWAFIDAPWIDPVAATSVRVVSSGVIMVAYALVRNNFLKSLKCLGIPGVASRLTGGVLSGPVIGMFFYVGAFKYAAAGIVATLSGFSPVLILPVIALRYRVRIRKEAIIGAVVTIVGASIMGLR